MRDIVTAIGIVSDHDPFEDEAKYANLFPLLGLPSFCGLCCITIADFDLLAT